MKINRVSPNHLELVRDDGTSYSYRGNEAYVDENERRLRASMSKSTKRAAPTVNVLNEDEGLSLPKYGFPDEELPEPMLSSLFFNKLYDGMTVNNDEGHLELPEYDFSE
jgi:hypothetical protein